MQPHHRARAGGGHGIGGLEVRKNIELHFSPAGREIARPKLGPKLGIAALGDPGGALHVVPTRPGPWGGRLVEKLLGGLLQVG